MAKPDLTIVIPAYKDEGIINDRVESLLRQFDDVEIIVVSDAYKGNRMGENIPYHTNVKHYVVPHIGKGFAVMKGFEWALGRYVGFTDADDSTSASEFKRIFEELKVERLEGAIGSRRGQSSAYHETFWRNILSIGFSFLSKHLFKLGYLDTQCGAKIFKREAAKSFLPFKSRRFAFDIEILLKARKLGYKIKEISVDWVYEPSIIVGKPFTTLRMFFDLIKLRWQT